MPAYLPPTRYRWFLYGFTVLLFVAGVWYFSIRKKNPEGRWGPNPAWAVTADGRSPAMPVRVAQAEHRDLPVYIKAIGTVTPLNTVTVQSRVDGQLLRVAFEEGQWVEKGQLLAEIDPEPYRIRLAQAEGQLGQSEAQVKTARADLERFQQLYEKNLVTNQQIEAQRALVSQREGALSSDQAAAENARLQLAYTKIEAPIAGRLGLRRVDAGNLIRANTTSGLVTITQTRPIAVMSTVPEVDLPKVLEPLRAGEKLVAEAWDRSEQNLLATGVLITVDNQIDLATGTLKIKAEFPNTNESLSQPVREHPSPGAHLEGRGGDSVRLGAVWLAGHVCVSRQREEQGDRARHRARRDRGSGPSRGERPGARRRGGVGRRRPAERRPQRPCGGR